MILACTSGTHQRQFQSGDLTQLEFLDVCARESACESVILNVAHFPRTDSDYLAQLKKMATDLGIGIAALHDDGLLCSESGVMEERLAQARALGAPLLLTRAAPETAMPWGEQLERVNHATSHAKHANVTLALRNARGTFAGTSADCKRVSKEADSAWLRFAFDPGALDDTSDPAFILEKAVAMCAPLRLEQSAIDALIAHYGARRGPLVLDGDAGDGADIQSATRRWRIALSQFELNRI